MNTHTQGPGGAYSLENTVGGGRFSPSPGGAVDPYHPPELESRLNTIINNNNKIVNNKLSPSAGSGLDNNDNNTNDNNGSNNNQNMMELDSALENIELMYSEHATCYRLENIIDNNTTACRNNAPADSSVHCSTATVGGLMSQPAKKQVCYGGGNASNNSRNPGGIMCNSPADRDSDAVISFPTDSGAVISFPTNQSPSIDSRFPSQPITSPRLTEYSPLNQSQHPSTGPAVGLLLLCGGETTAKETGTSKSDKAEGPSEHQNHNHNHNHKEGERYEGNNGGENEKQKRKERSDDAPADMSAHDWSGGPTAANRMAGLENKTTARESSCQVTALVVPPPPVIGQQAVGLLSQQPGPSPLEEELVWMRQLSAQIEEV
jgi:hypothetical protein